jgi:hypothetical protein
MKLKGIIKPRRQLSQGREEVVIDLLNLDGSEYEGGGGGGDLDFASGFGVSIPSNGTDGFISPQDPTVATVLYGVFNMGVDSAGVEIGFLFEEEPDAMGVVLFSEGSGLTSFSAEVPPGCTYRVYCDGPATTVQSLQEVPRSG